MSSKHNLLTMARENASELDADNARIAKLEALVAERDAMLGKRPCQNSRCNELNSARSLLREVANSIQECDTGGIFDKEKMRIRSYLDVCDTLEGKC